MAKPTVVGFIFDGTADLFKRTVENLYSAVHDTLTVPFHMMVALFIIVIGYSILTSKIEISKAEIYKILITTIIVLAAFNAGDDIVPPMIELFIETPNYIAGSAIQKSRIDIGEYDIESPFYALEVISSTTGAFIYKAFSSFGVWDIEAALSMIVVSLILGLCVFYFTTMTTFTVVKSMLFIAMLIATSPLAIIFSLFSSTRFIAQGWISQLITYAVSYMLSLMLVIFIFYIANEHLETLMKSIADDSIPQASNLFGVSIICVIAAFSMKEIPSLAGAIGGGVSLSDDKQFRAKARETISTTTNWIKDKVSRSNTTTKS